MSDASSGEVIDKAAFIAEHGRWYRPVEHVAFDPFRRKVIKTPLYITILMRLASCVLIPLRLSVALYVTFITYILVKVFGPPVTPASLVEFETTFIPLWRRKIVVFATKLLGRALLLGLGFWTVEGSDDPAYKHEDAMGTTIVSNHSSLADPCLLAYLFAPSFVAKSQVNSIPGVGRVGAAQHAFYIDRLHGTRMSVAQRIANRQKMLQEASPPGILPSVAIFPEGTTTNGDYLLKFRTGAFIAGTPVLPVLIRYSYDWFSPSYESIKTSTYVMGLIMQFRSKVAYHRLPIYRPSDDEKADPTLYASNVHKLILQKSEEVFGNALVPSDSNLVDKLEYNNLVRGDVLKKGLRLNM